MSAGEYINIRAKTDFYLQGAQFPGTTEAASHLLLMTLLTQNYHTASSVAQSKGRACGLGRGPQVSSNLRSPHSFHSSHSLKILQCNINGLTTPATRVKLDQLLEIAIDNDIQVIAVQETKLKQASSLNVKGFSIYRVDRTSKGGGGLAFFIRDVNYQSIHLPSDSASDLEVQGIRIIWRGKSLNIINVYHPPNQKHLPAYFSSLLNSNTIILGDLNAKHSAWGCTCINTRGEDFLQVIDDSEALILNDGTHTYKSFSYDTSEALDIAITSSDTFPQCSWKVMDNIGSDHLPVLIELKQRQRVHATREKFWNFKKANWNSFRDEVDCDLASTPFSNDIEVDWKNFKGIILNKARKFIPRGNFKRHVPFFSHYASSLKPLLERRNLLCAASNQNNCLRADINKINAEIKTIYAQLKRSRWREMCGNLDTRTNNSKIWKIVKSINREQEQYEKCNSVTDTNGQIFPDDRAAANGLAAYYQEISRLNFTCENKHILRRAKNIIHGCRSTDLGNNNLNKDFSQQELLLAMALLDLTKSPGPDGIFGQMLEYLGNRGKQRLLDIINLSWIYGYVPSDWKTATIIPIKKPGKKTWAPGDFRPISLTSTVCKIMEKMVLNRIQYFIDCENLMPCEQYGYRKGHSTIDQVLFFCQNIRDAQNVKPTHHTIAALLDLSKAFDRVWKHKLLIKLHDTFNFRGNILVWIADFLHNRTIRVKFNKTFSDRVRMGQGVPQGSVLSPMLFTLFLAGIEKLSPIGVGIGMFADDIVLWCSGSDTLEMERNLNDTLTALSNFASEYKLCFNPTKSIATFFTTNKKLYNFQPKLKMDNQDFVYEKHPKYLGFILDPEWTCNKHIEHIVSKGRKRLNILKYIAGKDWGADALTLRDTYLTLIRPILEYGFPVYSCASVTNLDKLEKVQLSAARIITGLRRSCPREVVLYEANLQPIRTRRKANLSKYFNKLSSYGNHNRTSLYLNNWTNNQRLKKNSPFSQAQILHLPSTQIEPHSLKICLSPSEGLPKVHFNYDLNASFTKKDLIPSHLRQLALEIIGNIPDNAIKIYTDGSKQDDQAGSGIFIIKPGEELSISLRNPDFSSVFKSELIAIEHGLEAIINENNYSDLWILSDSRSSLQHLYNWTAIGDQTSISILLKLRLISELHEVFFQWIPSHVDIYGNERADKLAKEGCFQDNPSCSSLTFSEHYSLVISDIRKEWKIPPPHHWYAGVEPGFFFTTNCDRASRTAISRLASGHIRSLSFLDGKKTYAVCSRCCTEQASPNHILDCLGLSREDIYTAPLMVLDFLRVNGLLDLV